jgi:hypothetical protein
MEDERFVGVDKDNEKTERMKRRKRSEKRRK